MIPSLDYTKMAQKVERLFIKAWKKYFPPTEVVEESERAFEEHQVCLEKLGALDKRIREMLGVKGGCWELGFDGMEL